MRQRARATTARRDRAVRRAARRTRWRRCATRRRCAPTTATRCCSRQGDPSNELFVVESGRIAIATRSPDGRESVVAVLEDGGLFGELGLFDDEPRSADARALVESDVCSCSSTSRCARSSRRNPELLWVIVRLLARRLRATDEALADAVFLDVPARTAKRLLELAGDADEFQLPMTQEELAGMVGRVARAGRTRRWRCSPGSGWIEVEGGRSRLPHPRPRQARARAAEGRRRRSPRQARGVLDLGSATPRKRERASPGVGGVVGAVGGSLGRVDEAVVGVGVHDDLAVGAVRPRRRAARRCRRPASTGRRRRRSRASGTRRRAVSSGSRCPGPRQASGTRIIP